MFDIIIGSDHAGFEYKAAIIDYLRDKNIFDAGTFSAQSVDYPDYAHIVGKAVESGEAQRGILICGSGNGVCMTANKYPRVRAALCWTVELARLSRLHNDANVLCIPARFVGLELALQMVEAFLAEPFEGGRHAGRVAKICRVE